jgi:BUD22
MIESKTANSMPKRKRAYYGREEVDPTQEIELEKGELEKKLVHGRKVLNRALKTARGFERQKLSKRIKLATKGQDEAEAGRLQKELDVLKARMLYHPGKDVTLIVAADRLLTSQ